MTEHKSVNQELERRYAQTIDHAHILPNNIVNNDGGLYERDIALRRRAAHIAASCSACKFWNRNGEPYSYHGTEEDDPDEIVTDKQKCLRVVHSNSNSRTRSDTRTDPAIVTDGSGYAASFWTEPSFACSSFERRDD